MYGVASAEVMERIGKFIDNYVVLQDGTSVPRNVTMFKESFLILLQSGTFRSVRDIKQSCLREQYQIIPDFLFEKVYALEEPQKKSQAKPLDRPPKI